ncbi:hypothetical protein [Chitinilyticum litopenaei]|uniref:hypothetical protein n=1 Tax=Chitinilyticum litopenaei TaxID=1121276 RepID=UPI00048C3DA5|nr:hypothetical protein [Chitinilyticum litopenaei]
MSDMTLNIDTLLVELDTALRTMTLSDSLRDAPVLLLNGDWDSLPAPDQRGRLLAARGVLSEARRLKTQLSTSAWSSKQAALHPGDLYWIALCASFGGTE